MRHVAVFVGSLFAAFTVFAFSGRAESAMTSRAVLPMLATASLLESLPVLSPDPSRSQIQLDEFVVARPVVDEFGNRGIELYDLPTRASYGWLPGRSPVVFQGDPEFIESCRCFVYDIGYSRVLAYSNPEGLARLVRGEPYSE